MTFKNSTLSQSTGFCHTIFRSQLVDLNRAFRVAAVILFTGCTSMTTEIDQAEQLGAHGDWDAAVTVYRQLMRQDPTDVELMQRYDAARAQAADAHFVAGQRAFQDRRNDEAILEYKLAMGY